MKSLSKKFWQEYFLGTNFREIHFRTCAPESQSNNKNK